MLTAYGSVPDAVSAMRDGALDYLTKPISFDQLQATAAQVMHRAKQMQVGDPAPAGDIVGSSPLLLRAIQRARSAAGTGADVLIEAESGTGKELLARFIHDSSDRCRKPFVAVNCAAVPEALLESELFGHGRGAFTGAVGAKPGKFELADGGTILLDEIGEMPLHLQPKLLRALQEREFERLGEGRSVHVDIRVIATTNVSLAAMVERGQFRGDLYYRLNVIPLSLPPLRDRREDIPVLAQHFARKYAAQLQTKPPRLHPGVPRSAAVAVLAGKCPRAGQLHAPGADLERDLGNRRRLLRDGISERQPGPHGLRRRSPVAGRGARGHSDPPGGAAASGKHPGLDGWEPHSCRRNAGHQPAHTAQQNSRVWSSPTEVRITWPTFPMLQQLQGYLQAHQPATGNDCVEHGERRYARLSHQGHGLPVGDATGGELEGNVQMQPASREVEGLPERPDGNNVNIDRESLLLSQTQLQYQMGVQLIKAEFHKLLTAIKEGS